jgi:hypothetical protein
MRFAVVLLVASCQMSVPEPAPVPAPHAPAVPRDAPEPADPRIGWPKEDAAAAVECMRDERQWGTTCCHTEGEPGRRVWQSCHGPQLGKVCHRRGDCDVMCECDRALLHHDGETGATGRCEGAPPSGEWTCEIDEAGKVTSLIID